MAMNLLNDDTFNTLMKTCLTNIYYDSFGSKWFNAIKPSSVLLEYDGQTITGLEHEIRVERAMASKVKEFFNLVLPSTKHRTKKVIVDEETYTYLPSYINYLEKYNIIFSIENFAISEISYLKTTFENENVKNFGLYNAIKIIYDRYSTQSYTNRAVINYFLEQFINNLEPDYWVRPYVNICHISPVDKENSLDLVDRTQIYMNNIYAIIHYTTIIKDILSTHESFIFGTNFYLNYTNTDKTTPEYIRHQNIIYLISGIIILSLALIAEYHQYENAISLARS